MSDKINKNMNTFATSENTNKDESVSVISGDISKSANVHGAEGNISKGVNTDSASSDISKGPSTTDINSNSTGACGANGNNSSEVFSRGEVILCDKRIDDGSGIEFPMINEITIGGIVTVPLRRIGSKHDIYEFSIRNDFRFLADDGEPCDYPSYFRVRPSKALVELCTERCAKGVLVLVHGDLLMKSWLNSCGIKHNHTIINAKRVDFETNEEYFGEVSENDKDDAVDKANISNTTSNDNESDKIDNESKIDTTGAGGEDNEIVKNSKVNKDSEDNVMSKAGKDGNGGAVNKSSKDGAFNKDEKASNPTESEKARATDKSNITVKGDVGGAAIKTNKNNAVGESDTDDTDYIDTTTLTKAEKEKIIAEIAKDGSITKGAKGIKITKKKKGSIFDE